MELTERLELKFAIIAAEKRVDFLLEHREAIDLQLDMTAKNLEAMKTLFALESSKIALPEIKRHTFELIEDSVFEAVTDEHCPQRLIH